MRKSMLVKNVISGVLAFSMNAAIAAPKASIDNEIQAMASGGIKNSQVRVQKAKAKQAKAKKAAAKPKTVTANKQRQKPITQFANPAAAATNPATDTSAFERFNIETSAPASTVSAKAPVVAEAKPSTVFTGSVGITVGKDSNATVEKMSIPEAKVTKGTFYEINPTVGYKGAILSGNFGARIKDFTNQTLSDTAKETQITADMAADYALGMTKGSTKIDFENSDSQWPDYLNGTTKGMPLRYFQSRISQKLALDLGQLNLQVGGSYANRDFTTPYMDNSADHIFGQTIFEQDQRIAEGNMRVGAKLAESFEIAVRPLMRHTKFSKEPARQTDGQKGGAFFNDSTPRREVIKQEGNLDLVLKTSRINITPTMTFGNDSDEAFGALDNTYRGGGITTEFIIDPGTSLKLMGSFNYKQVEYDNWTYNGLNSVIANNEKRKDTEKATTAGASVNFTKNIGFGVNYTRIEEVSNWQTPDENYEQEIIGTTLSVSF